MKDKVYQYIQQFMDTKELPGLAVGVVRDGKIWLAEGFGVRSMETREPVTAESMFHMASVSKPFSANAIMRLVEQGLVDLDATVVSYLPYFRIDDDRYQGITVQQMLSHISGMPDVMDYEWENPYKEDDALEKYIRSLTPLKLKFAPGTEFSYSNIAYEVLGDMIAKMTGLTFEEAIKQNLFSPLGMLNSSFLRAEVPTAQRVTPHVRYFENVVGPVYPYNRAHAPSSTLHSCAQDMCRWMLANLNLGEYDGQRILEASSYDLLWKEMMPASRDQVVGLSWFIGKHRDFITIGHGGSDDGFRSQLAMIPEKTIGVTVMSNINPAPLEVLAEGLFDILLGETPKQPLKPILYMIADTYQKVGFQAALDQLHACKENETEYDLDVQPFLMLGHSLVQVGRAEQALELLNLGLVLDPNSAILHAGLAYVYHNLGELENRQAYLEKALELDPEDNTVKYLQFLME